MLGGHIYELLIVLVVLVILVGGIIILVRTVTRSAAREYARARIDEERRQRQRRP